MWRFAGAYNGVVEDQSFNTKREAVKWMEGTHDGTAKLNRRAAGFYFALVTGCGGDKHEYVVYKAGDDGVRPAHWYYGRLEDRYTLASEYTGTW
jgi:hypothetical protein